MRPSRHLLLAGTMLMLTSAALADTVAPPPALADPVQILTSLGLGGQAAAIVGLYLLFSNVATILMPWLPIPTASSTVWWCILYALMNKAGAHNYRNAANAAQPPPVAGSPVPPVGALVAVLAVLALAGCTAAQVQQAQQTAGRLVQQGQLVCAQATPTGQLIVALVSAVDGRAVLAANAAKAFVDLACAGIGAIPVTPPPPDVPIPVVAIVPPRV